ncbi:MAG: hypothetical protein CL910_03215 [Deltaproteobacteria bacterium]|nr:hypothetical protein [Deltaproteobacteria bacterium]
MTCGTSHRQRRGMALIAVMFFMLLAVTGVATFLRRATVDGMVARNRDYAARCEALARGGVHLATGLLLQDKLDEAEFGLAAETREELWAQVGAVPIVTADGGELRLHIEDAGSRINLNSVISDGAASHEDLSEAFLAALLDRVVQEIPGADEERSYDIEELARNLLDYMDEDEVRIFGGSEDDYYLAQDPPYRAANRPLLSVDELALVEGFRPALVDALRPYVTVQPIHDAAGINPNTAPPWVLALLYHGTGDMRFASEDTVRDVLELRENGAILCSSETGEDCTSLGQAVDGEIFPPPGFVSDVFRVESVARYGDVERTVVVWIDRSEPAEPVWLAWDVR